MFRGRHQGPFLDSFDLFFGQCSVNFPDDVSVQILDFLSSRPYKGLIYAVFDEESDFQVKNKEIRRPEAKQ